MKIVSLSAAAYLQFVRDSVTHGFDNADAIPRAERFIAGGVKSVEVDGRAYAELLIAKAGARISRDGVLFELVNRLGDLVGLFHSPTDAKVYSLNTLAFA